MSIHMYTTAALAATLLVSAGCGSGGSAQVLQTTTQSLTTATRSTATQSPTTTAGSSPAEALPPPSEADREVLEKALAIATAECVRVGAAEFSTGGKSAVSQARASI